MTVSQREQEDGRAVCYFRFVCIIIRGGRFQLRVDEFRFRRNLKLLNLLGEKLGSVSFREIENLILLSDSV